MVVDPSGAIRRYWCEHLQDQAGALTDKPVDYTDQLERVPAEEFDRFWRE
jgi:hypothetical protein